MTVNLTSFSFFPWTSFDSYRGRSWNSIFPKVKFEKFLIDSSTNGKCPVKELPLGPPLLPGPFKSVARRLTVACLVKSVPFSVIILN